MRYLRYAGEAFLTGDDLAAAVMRLAEALASQHSTASIRIPVRMPDGATGEASMLLGPGTQLAMTPGPPVERELVDSTVLGEVESRIEQLTGAGQPARDPAVRAAVDRWYDDL